MKKNSIVIKGNKYGIVVVMDSDTSFDEIKNQLEEKLKESARFSETEPWLFLLKEEIWMMNSRRNC